MKKILITSLTTVMLTGSLLQTEGFAARTN